MNGTKIILGIAISSVFTGLLLAVVTYFAAINDHGGSGFIGGNSSWWPFAVLAAVVFGIVVGGLSGMVIGGFRMTTIGAVLFGIVVNLLIAVVIYILTTDGNGYTAATIRYPLYSLIPIGVINSVIVSFFNSPQQHLE